MSPQTFRVIIVLSLTSHRINAAVLGSKNAKHDAEEEATEEDGKVEEHAIEDANATKEVEAAEQPEPTDQAEAEDKTDSA